MVLFKSIRRLWPQPVAAISVPAGWFDGVASIAMRDLVMRIDHLYKHKEILMEMYYFAIRGFRRSPEF